LLAWPRRHSCCSHRRRSRVDRSQARAVRLRVRRSLRRGLSWKRGPFEPCDPPRVGKTLSEARLFPKQATTHHPWQPDHSQTARSQRQILWLRVARDLARDVQVGTRIRLLCARSRTA
jgi:hypothetical protein